MFCEVNFVSVIFGSWACECIILKIFLYLEKILEMGILK